MNKSKGKSQKAKPQVKSQNRIIGTSEFWVVVLSFAFLLLPSLAWTCALCKEALFDPSQIQQKIATAKGYALSIGLMLMMPLSLVGGVTTLVVRAYRRRRRVDTPTLSR